MSRASEPRGYPQRAGVPSDRVLIPLPGLGLLALERATFEAGLVAGAELVAGPVPTGAASDPEQLLDAETAATRLGVTARWLEDSARAGIVPHYKLGRFIRFRVSDIAAHCRVDGGPIPTDSQSVMRSRTFARQ